MKYRWVLAIFMIFSVDGQAKTHSVVKCTSNQLESFDCHLKISPYHLHFRKEKIHIDNKVWKKMHPFPIKGERVQWKEVVFKKLGRRFFVEVLAWDPPVGEAEVQSLRWVVFEVLKTKLNPRLDQVIQKRQRDFKSKDLAYQYDKSKKHKLDLNKKDQIYWFAGKKSGGL